MKGKLIPESRRGWLADELEKGATALEADAEDLQGRGNPADHPAVRERKLKAAADVRAYAERIRNEPGGMHEREAEQARTLANAARCEGILSDPMVPHRQFAQDDAEYGGVYLTAWAKEHQAKTDLVESGDMVRVADPGQVPFFALTSYGGWREALAELPAGKPDAALSEYHAAEDQARKAARDAVDFHAAGVNESGEESMSWQTAIELSGLDNYREPDRYTMEKRAGRNPFAETATGRTPEAQAHWDEIGRAEIEREQARVAAATERTADDVDGCEP